MTTEPDRGVPVLGGRLHTPLRHHPGPDARTVPALVPHLAPTGKLWLSRLQEGKVYQNSYGTLPAQR